MWLDIFDIFSGYHPLVPPEGDTDGSAGLLDFLKLAENLAALIHIQRPVGLGEQLGELVVHPAGFIPGSRLALGIGDEGQVKHHGSEGAVHPGRDAEIDFGPLSPELAVGHGVEVDSEACRRGILFELSLIHI